MARRDGPMTPTLRQIIEDMSKGIYQLPDLQRDFVWDDEKRLLLCDSIYQGLPIGSILVWRTKDDRAFQTRKEIRGVALPEPPGKGVSHYYVIDGLQRLTTLYLTFRERGGPSIGDEVLTPPIFFDLSNPKYERGSPLRLARAPGERVLPPFIPLTILFQAVELRKYQMNLLKTGRTEWLDESEVLVSRFRDYELPVIPLVTDDFDIVAETFVRVNSTGAKIEERDVVRALLWADDVRLEETFEYGLSELATVGWGGLDQDLMLMVLKVCLDLDVYRTRTRDFVEQVKARPETVRRLPEVLAQAAVLFNGWGLCGPLALPYRHQFVAVARAFFSYGYDPVMGVEDRLKRWVYQTAYGSYFRGLPGDRLGGALDFVLKLVAAPGLDTLPDDCSSSVTPVLSMQSTSRQGTRERLFMISMAREIDRRLQGPDPSSYLYFEHQKLVAQVGKNALFALYPHSRTRDPGNLVVCTPEVLAALRAELWPDRQITLFPGRSIDPEHYLISPRALDLARAGRVDEFIEERRRDLDALERAFVESLGLTWVE